MKGTATRGSAALSALIVLAAVALLLGAAFQFQINGIRQLAAEAKSRRNDLREFATLVRGEFALLPSLPQLNCKVAPPGGDSWSRGICGISGFIPDYDLVSAGAVNCIATETTQAARTPGGFLLSETASLWPTSCAYNNPAAFSELKVFGNLDAAGQIDLRPGATNVLFASGYADVAALLVSTSDALVVAGGDLRITKLANGLGSAVRLTAVSATGVVLLGSIEGEFSLNVKAHLGTYLPSGTLIEENGLLPPELGFIPFGLVKSPLE